WRTSYSIPRSLSMYGSFPSRQIPDKADVGPAILPASPPSGGLASVRDRQAGTVENPSEPVENTSTIRRRFSSQWVDRRSMGDKNGGPTKSRPTVLQPALRLAGPAVRHGGSSTEPWRHRTPRDSTRRTDRRDRRAHTR